VLVQTQNHVKIGNNTFFTILSIALKPQMKYMQISVLVEDMHAFLSILSN